MKRKTSQTANYLTPFYKFQQQRRSAKVRGIEWQMTFEEWWSVWMESGHWEQRGCRDGQYCMGRHGDVGPYTIGNVSIILTNENHAIRRGVRTDLPIGVHVFSGKFVAKRRNIYLGRFDTPELAHAAYLMAGEQQARAAA